ncbi:N-formylglutamate amidohydrolase [Sphingopyxis sp. MWB1]|uniref:N-formylglutamate amidohydrolase n=1 Tax=Sphingopyxis sp. MWB1 TaxID=1537715 RepID=UPI00051A87F2|nr:N-formylglutamate amidohydrolase [Sphingopyxis sp. MWB1]
MNGLAAQEKSIHVDRPANAGPVVVSVPHAGRIYPPELLAAARVDKPVLERLEDRWCDLIAAEASAAGAVVVRALWARAVADCNRGEGQMAPAEVAPAMRPRFTAPGRKERAGLGVVPTRIAGAGPLWTRTVDEASFEWRLTHLHRPYHRRLAEEIEAARRRHGRAILIDLHSMPPIARGQPGHGAQIVVGDHFGESCVPWLSDLAIDMAARLGGPVARNQPYAGGHILHVHGRPQRGIDAIQIEIDRSLYLTAARQPDEAQVARLARWFAALVLEAGRGAQYGTEPLAAE